MKCKAACFPLLLAAGLLGGCNAHGGKTAGQPASSGDVPAAATLDPARSQALYLDVIRKLRDDGKSHAALAYLDDFDRRYPANADARLLRADCLLDISRFTEAQMLYQGLLATLHRAAAEAGIGHVAAERGDWASAAAAYRRAIDADPIHVSYRNDLGFALLKSGALDQAIFMLRQANELAPDNALIRNNLNLALASARTRRK